MVQARVHSSAMGAWCRAWRMVQSMVPGAEYGGWCMVYSMYNGAWCHSAGSAVAHLLSLAPLGPKPTLELGYQTLE